MGTNKALLPWRGRTLLDYIADEVAAAAGCVTVVGESVVAPLRSIPDQFPGFGPVGGIATALADSRSEWTLIVACDMPGINRDWLRRLLTPVKGDAVIPVTPDGRLHPLCAAWNRSALGCVRDAVHRGVHTVREVVQSLSYRTIPAEDHVVANVNTPEDWACFAGRQE